MLAGDLFQMFHMGDGIDHQGDGSVLSESLQEVPHFREADQLRPLFSGSAMPATDFRTGDAAFPAILFHSPIAFKLEVTDLLISDRKSAGKILADQGFGFWSVCFVW
ncbi:hypothetical protein EN829_054715 [Mesorhizobium sp. M00.F.Ca.ET.186.01.1.1]|nr:hypothetical protein EN829_054715 [Mesorhizobium sp. M00.F.Ca.ET.186.01.1.1]